MSLNTPENKSYNGSHFDFSLDPLISFERELQRASQVISQDPNAMSLATASMSGEPSLRTVLYKGMVRGGVSFYTNFESHKSIELQANPQAAALFFWNVLMTQVRFEGQIFKLSRSEAEAYFKIRPRLSQLGAWASDQSKEIPDRQFLANKLAEVEKRFENQEVPCPPHWGGWHLIPLRIEFWYGQEGRLHDRYCFERTSISEQWQRLMKSP